MGVELEKHVGTATATETPTKNERSDYSGLKSGTNVILMSVAANSHGAQHITDLCSGLVVVGGVVNCIEGGRIIKVTTANRPETLKFYQNPNVRLHVLVERSRRDPYLAYMAFDSQGDVIEELSAIDINNGLTQGRKRVEVVFGNNDNGSYISSITTNTGVQLNEAGLFVIKAKPVNNVRTPQV